MDFRFASPFRLCLVGPSQSGKNVFFYQLLQHGPALMDPLPAEIKVFFKTTQPLYSEMERVLSPHYNITFIEGLPTEQHVEEAKNSNHHKLWCIDDFSNEYSPLVVSCMNVISHHHQLSMVILSHQLFSKDPHWRAMTMAATHLGLKRNVRDQSSIAIFARQFAPTKPKSFLAVFDHVTKTPYQTLLVDLTATCPDQYRLRSNIFKHESPMRVYTLQ